MNPTTPANRTAIVHRMVTAEHVCPYGLKAVDLLKRKGFQVDDRHLETREETDAFKAEHGLDTTPLVFVGDERIGGARELEAWLSAR